MKRDSMSPDASSFALWKLWIVTAFLNVFVAGIHFGARRWAFSAVFLDITAVMLAVAYVDARRRRG